MPPRCECAINNVKNWRPIEKTYLNHTVYFCPGCEGLFTKVHMGTVSFWNRLGGMN
jgi:hypothetical protein